MDWGNDSVCVILGFLVGSSLLEIDYDCDRKTALVQSDESHSFLRVGSPDFLS